MHWKSNINQSDKMKICDINVGREGNEWVVVISHQSGKVTECRDVAFEEILLAITKEIDDLE